MEEIIKHLDEALFRFNKVKRELAEASKASVDSAYIDKLKKQLNEHFHTLVDIQYELKEKKEQLQASQLSQPSQNVQETGSSPSLPKRAPGGQKQYYLANPSHVGGFVDILKQIVEKHYIGGKKFLLLDGVTRMKAHVFLLYLYDLGIKHGIASVEAPMKDYSDMVLKAASLSANGKDLNTAYNTMQKEKKHWGEYLHPTRYILSNEIYLHDINPERVLPSQEDNYKQAMELLAKVEEIFLQNFKAIIY